jgi:hypothetical protein
MHLLDEPPRYCWSGRVRFGRFLMLALMVLACAATMAWVLHLCSRWGWYLVVIAPIIAALPVAGLMNAAVAGGHCRNPVLAALVGLVAGLIVSPGHYQADIAAMAGWEHVYRLDILPRYLEFRMNTNVFVDVARGGNQVGAGPDQVGVIFNWVLFAVETLIACGCIMGVGIQRSRKAYAEEEGRWMERAVGFCQAGVGAPVAEALRTGRLGDLREALVPMDDSDNAFCELILEYCPPGDDASARGPAFLTINEVMLVTGKANGRKETALARQWQIDPRDVDLLAVEVAAFAPARRAAVAEPPPLARTARGSAEIQPVPEPYGGTVLTPWHLTVGTIIAFLPLVLSMGTAGAALAYGANHGDDLSTAETVLLLGTAVGVLVLGFWFVVCYSDFLPSRYLYRLSKQAVFQRPDRLVEPDNPEALYVQVIPRRNWGRVMLENASDIGFLWVDRSRRLLLFEGDRERWRIPAQAIVSCEVQHFLLGGDQHSGGKKFFLAVLRAQTGDAVWEAPVTRRHIYWGKRLERQREEDANLVRTEILSLITPAENTP